jgi:hypothetical protein
MAERRDREGEAAEEGRLFQLDGDAETIEDVDLSGEDALEEEEAREEYHPEVGEPAERVEGALNPAQTQRQARDAADSFDRGYMEDRDFERDEEEGRSPTNAKTRDPLEGS